MKGHVARYRHALLVWAWSLGVFFLALMMGVGAHPALWLPLAASAVAGVYATAPRRGLVQWALLASLGAAAVGTVALIQSPQEWWGLLILVGLGGAAVTGTAHGVHLAGWRSVWAWAPAWLFGVPVVAVLAGLVGEREAVRVFAALWASGAIFGSAGLWVHRPEKLAGFDSLAARAEWAALSLGIGTHRPTWWGVAIEAPGRSVRIIGASSPARIEVEARVPDGLFIAARRPGSGQIGDGTGDLVMDTALVVRGSSLQGLHAHVLPVVCEYGAVVRDGWLRMTLRTEVMRFHKGEWWPTPQARDRILAALALADALRGSR